jgi:COPII coat assembly protein SEC16
MVKSYFLRPPSCFLLETTEQLSPSNDTPSRIQDAYAQPSNVGTVADALQSIHYTPAQPRQAYNPPATYSNSTYSHSPASAQSSGSRYNSSYSAAALTSYIQPNIDSKPPMPLSVPPSAPVPVEAINRPKLSNAYDPPFPATTKSRRNVARLNQTYSGYNSYQPALLPPVSTEGPFVPLPAPQVPRELNSEGAGLQPSSEWGYPNHKASISREAAGITAFSGPSTHSASVEGLHGQANTYDGAVDVHSTIAPPSDHIKSSTPDYAVTVLPNSNQAHDLYRPASPTKSQSSPPALPHPSANPFRGTIPQNPLSLPPPLSGHPSVHSRPNTHIQANLSTAESNDSSGFSTENLGDPSTGLSGETSNATHLNDLGFVHDVQDRQTESNDMFPATEDTAAYFPASINGQSYDPYAPNSYINGSNAECTSSPNSVKSWMGTSGKPYSSVNQHSPPRAEILRNRSMSNGAMVSTTSASVNDPYAPSQHPRRQKSETDYGSYGYQRGRDSQNHPSALMVNPQLQEVLVKPFQTPYAPSPSLLGANDPLGRTAARIPVFSFGFGGKFVTCFHGAASFNTGFDVALSSRNSTGVHIHLLRKLIPDSALDTSTVVFPGPLFSDPGSLTNLVRTGSISQTKTKKPQVVKYLSERTDEIALGLRYLNPDSIERRRAEGKLILIKVLKVMVENDGRLTGT